MPYRVKIDFERSYNPVTVSNGHYPYRDIHGTPLEDLNVAAGNMYEISVALIHGTGTVVIETKDGSEDILFPYAIPRDCDVLGKIYVPPMTAASQSDVEKLAEEVAGLKQAIMGPK
ncbi:hypothetical protein K6M90_23925 [Rhizobium sp. 9T]|uniref:hypothetical protein n=1 Tax=Rhizobium croatiense TaxID=2867516 RepID=UPI001C93642D|nr:hypothetical protein [Rhizobium croatiense]MBY4610695.1 hypothetical protein [Rhizobium croatiense]